LGKGKGGRGGRGGKGGKVDQDPEAPPEAQEDATSSSGDEGNTVSIDAVNQTNSLYELYIEVGGLPDNVKKYINEQCRPCLEDDNEMVECLSGQLETYHQHLENQERRQEALAKKRLNEKEFKAQVARDKVIEAKVKAQLESEQDFKDHGDHPEISEEDEEGEIHE